MATPVILLGLGGNVVDLLDTIEDVNADGPARYEVLGYIVDREDVQGQSFHGYPVLGRFADVPALAARHQHALFSTFIGGVGTYLLRHATIARLGVPTERFLTIVHPTSYVSKRAQIGRGVIVYQNCTIANLVTLGDHVVVLPNTVVSHDDVLADYTVVAGGAALAGAVKVGPRCYLGTNCSIHPGVTIGEGSLVGMGAVVRHDVPPFTVVVGNPAQVLRQVTPPE